MTLPLRRVVSAEAGAAEEEVAEEDMLNKILKPRFDYLFRNFIGKISFLVKFW